MAAWRFEDGNRAGVTSFLGWRHWSREECNGCEMSVVIRQITEADIPSYHACLDVVAREQRYLALLAAPPLEQSRAWILPHIRQNHPYFVATEGERVIGWCDITPLERE